MDLSKQLLILVSIANMVLAGEWSPCSRTCGVGIMQRTIPCQKDNGCDEIRKEFQACDLKRCPDGNADFRTEQCKTFGESFTNNSDPCKLLCSSPGENPVMKGLVVDGTPCPSNGVCVDGQCVPFGCDEVLGSKKTINKCGTCSDLCVQLPCKFKKITSNDYHTTIPYESTNISIAMDSSSCSLKAISNSTKSFDFSSDHSDISMSGTVFAISDNELTAEGPLQSPVTIEVHCPRTSHKLHCNYYESVYIPDVLEISNIYEWVVGENYTPCSQTCGRGIQVQEIYCRTHYTRIKVSDFECTSIGLLKDGLFPTARFCDQPACPSEWIHSDWTQCSKSCGGGDRMRNVSCMQVIRDGVEPIQTPGKCDTETKPASQHECNKHPCRNHWHTGEWSRCSIDCGEGIQSRHVTCRDSNGNEIYRHSCSSQAKPPSERSCTGDMCVHKWIKSNWTNCSVGCGEGVQTRHVNCTENGTVVDDSVCLKNTPIAKPLKERACQGPYCNGYWVVGNWQKECISPGCHKLGVQYRNVFCIRNGKTSEEFDYIKCDPDSEPLHQQGCYMTEGCPPEWFTTVWDQCSTTCGGVQRRKLYCKLGNETLPDQRCPDSGKPSIRQSCGPECPTPKICLTQYCHRDDLSKCQKQCCEHCKNVLSILPSLARYNLCEKPCCKGTQSWKNTGCT